MKKWIVQKKKLALIAVVLMAGNAAIGQDNTAGIEDANIMVRESFDVGIDLMYAVGAILGLIGGVRVYQRWASV